MKSILVIGAAGQLGSELRFLSSKHPDMAFHFTDQKELDITDPASIAEVINAGAYNYCINCAAYTAVDKAEDDKALAYAINDTAAGLLAEQCAAHNIKLVHVSTDFVFDGQLSRPYKEDDTSNPLGVYGASKAAGEQRVLNADPSAVIIRTSWLYSSYGANFVKTMRKLGEDRDSLNVIYDQVGTPTYARDLERVILQIIAEGSIDNESGIFHYSNEGVASWYDLAVSVMRMSNLSCKVLPINTFEYPTPAARPAYGILDKRKIKETFDIEIPHWYVSLGHCIEELEKA